MNSPYNLYVGRLTESPSEILHHLQTAFPFVRKRKAVMSSRIARIPVKRRQCNSESPQRSTRENLFRMLFDFLPGKIWCCSKLWFCVICLAWFLSCSKQYGAEFNCHFAKWWSLDPTHVKFVKKSECGGIQTSPCLSRKTSPSWKGLLFHFVRNFILSFLINLCIVGDNVCILLRISSTGYAIHLNFGPKSGRKVLKEG